MSADLQTELHDIANRSRAARERFQPPDFSRLRQDQAFVPESFTQLYHTPLYRELDDKQRLRYNQLYGLRSNELFMLFEEGFTRRVILRLRESCASADPQLAECLDLMLEEESNHHRMFLDFNHRVLPEAYRDARGHFARPGPVEGALLVLLTARPAGWPFMLWIILLLEEFSTAFSLLLIRREASEGLCADYVRLHRLHMLDESRHVALDALLLQRLLPALSHSRLTANGRIFRFLLNEILAPKRSGIRVLHALVREFPDLKARLPAMKHAVRDLPHDPGMFSLVSDAETLPVTHTMMALYPAFDWFTTLRRTGNGQKGSGGNG